VHHQQSWMQPDQPQKHQQQWLVESGVLEPPEGGDVADREPCHKNTPNSKTSHMNSHKGFKVPHSWYHKKLSGSERQQHNPIKRMP
jgi:hypothetical protein